LPFSSNVVVFWAVLLRDSLTLEIVLSPEIDELRVSIIFVVLPIYVVAFWVAFSTEPLELCVILSGTEVEFRIPLSEEELEFSDDYDWFLSFETLKSPFKIEFKFPDVELEV
jgi:hypothetical protein